MTTATQQEPKSAGSSPLGEWKRRGTYPVACPSGIEVTVRIPDVSELAVDESLPDHLRAFALKATMGELEQDLERQDGESDEARVGRQIDTIRELQTFKRAVVSRMIVADPQPTADDLDGVPHDDLDMLYAIAMRERETDALGRWVGVEPLRRFERFRSLHDCPPRCPSCEEVRLEFSTGYGG
jgi:hypothetical protein